MTKSRTNDLAERIAKLKEVPGWRRSHGTNEALAIIEALVKEREEVWLPFSEAWEAFESVSGTDTGMPAVRKRFKDCAEKARVAAK